MKDIQWYPGHMARAIREIKENSNKIDLVIELRDARIPYSSKNPVIEEILGNKPRLILLNKSSLADNKVTNDWIDYLRSESTLALAVDSISGYNLKKIFSASKELLKEKIERNKSRGIMVTKIRAMVVGIPNVGKSTFINKVTKRHAAITGDRPGVTKAQKWVKINDDFILLDTPGILWPKFEDQKVGLNLAVCGSIKDEILQISRIVNYAINYLVENYPSNFLQRYGLEDSTLQLSSEEILDQIALNRHALLKGGIPDVERIYAVVLNDIRSSRLGAVSFEKPE